MGGWHCGSFLLSIWISKTYRCEHFWIMYIHTYGWFISYLTLWTGNRTVHKHNIQTRDEIRHLLVMLGFTLHKASYLHTEDCKTRRRLITLNDVRCQMSADGAIHLHPAERLSPSLYPSVYWLSFNDCNINSYAHHITTITIQPVQQTPFLCLLSLSLSLSRHQQMM